MCTLGVLGLSCEAPAAPKPVEVCLGGYSTSAGGSRLHVTKPGSAILI